MFKIQVGVHIRFVIKNAAGKFKQSKRIEYIDNSCIPVSVGSSIRQRKREKKEAHVFSSRLSLSSSSRVYFR